MSCVNLVCRSGGLTQDATTFYTLTVTKGGDGSGTVTSTPSGIDCGGDCTEELASETMVQLTPTAGTDSTFLGWGGACSGNGTCMVTMTQAQTVTAMFALEYSLVVTLNGNGSGFVTSLPAGINCGATCTEQFSPDTMVALTGFAANGSTFDGWSGAGAVNCTSNAPCTVTIDQAKMVTATFSLQKYALTITPSGSGTGTVTATGIDCGADCTESYDHGSMVSLTATPTTGSTFGGWSGGGCTGTDNCTVPMTQVQSVTAMWDLTTIALTVDKQGSGTVTSGPSGINCGSTCTASFNYNTSVTLSATPETGSVFSGWSNGTGNAAGCSGTGSCMVPLVQASMVTATFALTTPTLTAAKNGNGAGTVTSNTGGIDCGTDCTENPNYGSMVTLTAMPSTGSTFAGWSGGNPACSGTGSCVTTIDGAQTITATFTLTTHNISVLTNGGNGSGTVTGPNINCGGANIDCSETYPYGTQVSLTASPAAGSTFGGWSGGGCTGNGGCTVSVTMMDQVTATFTLTTHALTVANAGTGSGKVTSTDTNLDCGTDCVHVYNYNSSVTLAADPDDGSTFLNWTNGCGTVNPCITTVTAAKTVTANYQLSTHLLTVTRNTLGGNGGGSVTANLGTLDCPGDCTETYNYNATVTLTANPAAGSSFTGWNGELCSGTGTCVVTMTDARTVNAEFELGTNALSVIKTGTGDGTVTSTNPAGIIDCGADCSENPLNDGTMVTLSAAATTGSTFIGWTVNGSTSTCAGTGACTVTISAGTPSDVEAEFEINSYNLTVMNSGNGAGTVTSDVGAINCGANCVDSYTHGQIVQLSAAPDTGSSFAGWMGPCTGTGTCSVTMDQARMVIATFTKNVYQLTVLKSGTADGVVTSDVGSINCGARCTNSYEYGTVVELTNVDNAGADFVGWSGASCSGTDTCTVTVEDNTEITAEYAIETHTLTVQLAGPAGAGAVHSIEPEGLIDCEPDCEETVDYGTTITLKASATNGYELDAWSGGGCSGNGNCSVEINQAESVTATFKVATYLLTVNTGGTGTGTVTSSPSGINCLSGGGTGNDCTNEYDHDQDVELTATAQTPGNVFAGWSVGSGCTVANNPCTVDMLGVRTITATFNRTQHVLTVQKLGAGQGNIVSVPAGTINCPNPGGTADCSETVNYGNNVVLQANPAFGSSFSPATGWTGCTSVQGNQCTVNVTTAQTVTATFTVNPPNYVFVASTQVSGAISFVSGGQNLTGLAAADAICNDRANAAGGVPPGTYKAYLSTSTVGATSRLVVPTGQPNAGQPAGGWIRPDGLPVVNSVGDIQAGHLFYPIKLDEAGNPIPESQIMMTGTSTGGAYASSGGDCAGYTSATNGQPGVARGVASANSNLFSYENTGAQCNVNTHRFYCFGVDRQAVVAPSTTPPIGSNGFRRVFTTGGTFTPGVGYTPQGGSAIANTNGIAAADALCAAEGAGLGGTWKALLATVGASAISRFGSPPLSGNAWARPDNTLIANTANGLTSALTHLLASPNSNAQNTAWFGFSSNTVWIGAVDLVTAGTATTTCAAGSPAISWTSTTTALDGRAGQAGYSNVTGTPSWGGYSSQPCNTSKRVICMQQ